MDTNQIPEIVGKTIDTLASKLSMPASQLLTIAIDGKRLSSLIGLPIIILLLILSIIPIKLLYKNFSKNISDRNNGWQFFPIVIICFLDIALFFLIRAYLIGIFLPQYLLLMQFINQ